MGPSVQRDKERGGCRPGQVPPSSSTSVPRPLRVTDRRKGPENYVCDGVGIRAAGEWPVGADLGGGPPAAAQPMAYTAAQLDRVVVAEDQEGQAVHGAVPGRKGCLNTCMPCSFALLHHPRSAACGQPSRLLRVTVTIRWIPLVTAACGTWVARPARTTMLAPGDGSGTAGG
jgi:hypothetical protein